MPRALVGGDCVWRQLGSMGIILAAQFVLGAQFLLDLSGNVIGLLIGFLGLIFGRDLIVSWYSDEAAGKIHRGELGSCHLINVQIFGRSAGTGGSCQT